jgi:hydro-lyases, Fe-S type, tartrate/fumarate subfamily, alpha region
MARIIQASQISEIVEKLLLECNYYIGEDIEKAFQKALKSETSEREKVVIEQLLKNSEIAAQKQVPICQDTGMAVVFVEYGQDVLVEGKPFKQAIEDGVRKAYIDGYLRKSVVSDPVFDRKNTEDNTPAVIYTDIVEGDQISFLVGAKGFGSENMSAVKMLSPGDGVEGVKNAVLDIVRYAGPNPCPPIVVGVGIGGTFDKAAQLAKKASFKSIDEKHPDERYAKLEEELLEEINKMGIGAAGMGGKTTALGVNIETFPTHIAGMPVAVNICCHAARHASAVL